MNTESHYIYDQPHEAQGLGRMPTRRTMLRPVLEKPIPHNRGQEIRPTVLPRPIPKPVLLPRPVIDKNPAGASPKLNINSVVNTSTQQSHAATKSNITNEPTSKQQPNFSPSIPAGTFSIAGVQVTKTHAVMAGGIAGGLLLWKILF